ncbi:MAG TPA: DUF262 domain-containing protein [Ruminiclostridium sp.]
MLLEDLLIRNENIQHVFDWYCDGLLIVNRKYQRKLVWNLEEKQKFIESIYLNYPVPLILLAKIERDGKPCYEIIDGMQRLEALFSFISCEIPVNIEGKEQYFDLATMARTKELSDKGILISQSSILKREICTRISNYQLPLSITQYDDLHIEEIFRRINATGRQLSDQDLRQAGATGAFSNLVRKLAALIRRDSSPDDVLELSKMREISLSNRKLKYGIDLNNVFWVKQGIISVGNMRISRDEELIAYILTYVLLGKDVTPSAKILNVIYGYDEDDYKHLVTKTISQIEKLGEEKILSCFITVFDEIEKILMISKKNFNELLYGQLGEGKPRSFQVFYLSIYKLITDGKIISNYDKLVELLSGVGKRLLKDVSKNWNEQYREEYISALSGVIQACFIDANHEDPAVDSWVSKLENLLMQSKIEQQLFDLKIGLHHLEQSAEFNTKCLKKIVRTLTAMANIGRNIKGYVLVGIADNQDDAKLFSTIYSESIKEFNGFYINGVQSEISKKYKNTDEYFTKIKQFIEQEPIDDYTKSYILRYMRLVNYYNKCILVFSIESTNKPLLYDNAFYERRGSSVEKIEGVDILNLTDRFK